jgi:hypothetical protein
MGRGTEESVHGPEPEEQARRRTGTDAAAPDGLTLVHRNSREIGGTQTQMSPSAPLLDMSLEEGV